MSKSRSPIRGVQKAEEFKELVRWPVIEQVHRYSAKDPSEICLASLVHAWNDVLVHDTLQWWSEINYSLAVYGSILRYNFSLSYCER